MTRVRPTRDFADPLERNIEVGIVDDARADARGRLFLAVKTSPADAFERRVKNP